MKPDAPHGFTSRLLARLASALVAHPRRALWCIGLTLIPSLVFALQVEIRSSFLELLPEREKPVAELRTVMEHARATSDVAIAIDNTNPERAERFAHDLVQALERDARVSNVGGYIDPEWVDNHRVVLAPTADLQRWLDQTRDGIDRELLQASGMYVDLESGFDTSPSTPPNSSANNSSNRAPDGQARLPETTTGPQGLLAELQRLRNETRAHTWVHTSDNRYLCVWAMFSGNTGDLSFGRQAYDHVRALVAQLQHQTGNESLRVRYGGGIPVRVEDDRAFVRDLGIAGPLGFAAVVLLLVLALRSMRALVLLSAPLLVGLLWTFAFARLAVGHLNIISGFLFSILSGLGIEYGIHLLHRFKELRQEGQTPEAATHVLVEKTGRALATGALTNASVFAVIACSRFRGFSEFGLIAACGLMLTLLATLITLPAMLLLWERHRPTPLHANTDPEHKLLNVSRPLRGMILVAIPVLALLSVRAFSAGQLHFDGNWRMLAGSSEASRFSDYLRHHFDRVFTAGMIFVPNDADRAGVEAAVRSVRAETMAAGRESAVVDVLTLDQVLPPQDIQEERLRLGRELAVQLRRIPLETLSATDAQEISRAIPSLEGANILAADAVPFALAGAFLTRDGHGSMVHIRVRDTDDSSTDVLVRWAREVERVSERLRDEHIDAHVMSENWIAGVIFERIEKDSVWILLGALLAVFTVLAFDVGSLLSALAILSSVVLGFLTIGIGLVLFKVRINFMNAAILPIFFGISLDNAVHVFHRWRDEGPGSIPRVLRETSVANGLASATNLLGFVALLVTQHEGLRSVGWLSMLGVGATYVSTTLWFPLMLDAWDRRRSQPMA